MENLLLAIVSLVILVPIIYFLPLGLSTKGKILVTSVSFFLAVVGLFAQLSFPLWQTSLVLLLLVFLSSIVIDSRLKKIIYPPLSKEKDFFLKEEIIQDDVNNEEFGSELVDSNTKQVSNSKPLNLDKIVASHSLIKIDEEREEVIIDEYKRELEIESSEIGTLKNQFSFVEDNLLEEVKLTEDIDEDFEEDISFLFNRDELLEENSKGYTHHIQAKEEDVGYMSEIERMIEETDTIGLTDNINLLDYQLEEVAATKEIDNDEILGLKLEKIDSKEEIEDSIQEDEQVIWDDVIEPIKEFKINNSSQGGWSDEK